MRQPLHRSTILPRLVLGTVLALPALAAAHPGGLNAQGCHNNRKTGDYHCHRAQAPAPAPTSPYAPAGGGSSFAPSGAAAPMAAPATAPASGRAFRNCAEARAAGAAPVRRGDPGYGRHLDRDGDGVGCE